MAETITMTLHDNPDIKELLELLKSPGFQAQQKEYTSLLDGVEAIVKQYNNILTELDDLKEKVSKITDRKNPLVVMVENLEKLADDIGAKIRSFRDSIVQFTKNALDTVKEKGLSALGSVFSFLHVKDGLQAMSNGLAKSVEGLNKAVARVDRLEQHNRDKTAVNEGDREETQQPAEQAATEGQAPPTEQAAAAITEQAPPTEQDAVTTTEQAASLSEMLEDMRLDFENLTPEELKATYEKFLAIGMDNNLTANELNCLQYLTEQAESLLPDRGKAENAREAEQELDLGEEI